MLFVVPSLPAATATFALNTSGRISDIPGAAISVNQTMPLKPLSEFGTEDRRYPMCDGDWQRVVSPRASRQLFLAW